MTVQKPKPKQLLRPITTGAGSAMNQSQFLAITCNSLEAREISRVHGAIGFRFASHWLKNWRESFKPITKLSNRNHGITLDSHLKTALYNKKIKIYGKNAFLFQISPHFDRHENSTDVILCLYKMKRTDWLLCPAKNCDWFKFKIQKIQKNLNRALSPSMPLSSNRS